MSWAWDEWPWPKYTPDADWAILQDPQVMTMIMCAQATFLEFARAAEYERYRIVPTYEAIGIKAFFGKPEQPHPGEHIFLTNVFTDGKTITATLNADSWYRPDLKEGQELTFPIAKLSDWFLVRAGRGFGGFTISEVWDELSESQQEQFKNEPPFAWFQHRGTRSATDELFELPVCVKCNRRNVGDPTDVETPCAICRSGSRRCNCPKCGAPLIRNDKLPELCARCT